MGLLINQDLVFTDYNFTFTNSSYINVRDVKLTKYNTSSSTWDISYSLQIYTSQSSLSPLMCVYSTLNVNTSDMASLFNCIYSDIITKCNITQYSSV